MPGGAAVAASEARMVHVRPGRLPSTETDLALCIDRPRAEDPGRSGRSELSGSGPAPGGQERDRLEFQLSLSLHDGSWPSVGPTGPSKDPESRGAMGWKLLLPSHGTAGGTIRAPSLGGLANPKKVATHSWASGVLFYSRVIALRFSALYRRGQG